MSAVQKRIVFLQGPSPSGKTEYAQEKINADGGSVNYGGRSVLVHSFMGIIDWYNDPRVDTIYVELDLPGNPQVEVKNFAGEKLPEFVANHVLVAFHRDEGEAARQAAIDAQTNRERRLWEALGMGHNPTGGSGEYEVDDVVVVEDPSKAQGVTSYDPTLDRVHIHADRWDDRIQDVEVTRMHRPILDIDFPAALIPSSTPGHFHLYLDKPMEWSKYEDLLDALGNLGIIEDGYATASIERGYSSARLPWVKKEGVLA